jgi:hypothetical protein
MNGSNISTTFILRPILAVIKAPKRSHKNRKIK